MNTRGKTNAEFRNEVHEILAKHESSIDQVHSTLQTIMTELQAMRVSHHSAKPDFDINPFASGGSYHQFGHPDGKRATDKTDPAHHHLKLNFRAFSGDDPTGWLFKAKQYFDFKGISPDQQVHHASFHLEGIALQWHCWMTKFKGPLSWPEFSQAILLRFGPTDYEDPSEAISRLKQV